MQAVIGSIGSCTYLNCRHSLLSSHLLMERQAAVEKEEVVMVRWVEGAMAK